MRISLKRQVEKDDPTVQPMIGELRCFYIDPGDLSQYGWYPCDGGVHNGIQTPDLNGAMGQGKFLKGGVPGQSGGSSVHTHNVTQPNDHQFTPTGDVSQPTFTGNAVHLDHIPGPGAEFEGASTMPTGITSHDFTPSGTVSKPTFTGNQITLTHSGVSVNQASNEPPYITVKWYMYCGVPS